MNDKTRSDKAFKALREQAELLLKQRGSQMPDLDKNDFLRLAHELEVQQVELEVQNEELRGAKKELEQSREEFLDLYESAPVAYITLNEKGIIDRANRAACRLFEDFREIILGSPFSSFFQFEDLPAYNSMMRQLALNRKAGPVELRLWGKNGPIHLQVEATQTLDDNGRPQGRLALVDITGRKRAEAKLQKLTETLEERVRDRTAELLQSQEELRESEKRLQHLSKRLLESQEEERRRFAAEVHDAFSSPLSVLKHRIEAMDGDQPGGIRDLEKLKQEVQGLINESRRIQMALRPSLLDDVGIVAALKWFMRELPGSNSRLKIVSKIEVEENEVPEGIKTAIFRISQEAFSNIIKHSKATEIRLSLLKNGSNVTLEIQDNGDGFRADLLEKNKASGQGLGLLSMEERASLSGGVFTIRSEIGKGTTVRVSWSDR